MLHCGVAPDSSERRNMALIRTSNPVLNAKAFAGLALGGLSALLESKYPGIAMQAVACTFATFAAMFLAYRSGLIKATEKFKLGVVAATGAIALYYVVGLVLSFFGVAMPFLQGNSTASLVVSGVIVVVAALNLILDFDFIETGVTAGAPKFMEWYGAFGLMVTLIWLYLEIRQGATCRAAVRVYRLWLLPSQTRASVPRASGSRRSRPRGARRPNRARPPGDRPWRSSRARPGRAPSRTGADAAPARPRGGPPSRAPRRAPPPPRSPAARRQSTFRARGRAPPG